MTAPTDTLIETAVEIADPAGDPVVVEDVLVEDVSIDGMCGVY